MRGARLRGRGALSAACLTLILGGCATQYYGPTIKTGAQVPNSYGNVISLSQGWSQEQQQWFWFVSQGSQLLS